MGTFRRWAVLPVLGLLIATLVAVTMPRASADTMQSPERLYYACALKTTGSLKYIANPPQCDYTGKDAPSTLVRFVNGPYYACVRSDDSSFLIGSPSDCPVPQNKAERTLPPPKAPVYFCVLKSTNLLSEVAAPAHCPASTRFSVVVPVTYPVLAGVESAALPYTAGAQPVPVTPTLTVRSSSSATLAGATVRIGSGFVAGQDSLRFTSQNGISGSFNGDSGVLTLTGTTSVASYRAALRSVSYGDRGGPPGQRTISFQVADQPAGHGLSNVVSRTVSVTGVTPPVVPVISGIETTALSYQSGTPPVPVTSTLAISDGDDATLSGATVSITAGLDTADDVLAFAGIDGITGSYQPISGVLALSGNASIADYQAALRTVKFATDDGAASPTARTVSFSVTDTLSATSAFPSRTVTVTEIAPPIAVDHTATTGKNSPVDINVLANDTDPAGLPLTVFSFNTSDTVGSVSLNGNGTIHYDPNGQFTGLTQGQSATTTFGYTATDGNQNSNSATVTVTITGSNDAPVITGIRPSALEYRSGTPPVPVTSTLAISDDDDTTLSSATLSFAQGFDAGADTLSFTNQDGITGSYNASTGVLTLTGSASTADYQAALRSVEFSTDDPAATPKARIVAFSVTDSVGAASGSVGRTVLVAEIAPPVAVDDTATTGKNSPVDINVLANDTDPAGLPLTIETVDASGTLGSVSINGNGTIQYDPNGQFTALTQGQSATDTFTYIATDGNQDSDSGTVTVTITGSDDAPVVSGIETTPLSYQSGTPAVAVTSALAISDDDDATMSGATVSVNSGFDDGADTLSFSNQNGITGSYDGTAGVLTLSGNASTADYQAALQTVEFATTDRAASPAARIVSFAVTDSLGATSTAAARTIDVTAVARCGIETTPTGPTVAVRGDC